MDFTTYSSDSEGLHLNALMGFSAQLWETMGVWLGALGSTGAFVVAFALAFGERRKNHRLAERSQASQVSAWLDVGEFHGEPRVRIHAKNGSSSQVNDFKCTVLDTINPQDYPAIVWFPGIAPTGEPIVYALNVELPSHLQQYRYELIFEFTDVQNRRWRQARGEGLVLQTRKAPQISYGPHGKPLEAY